MTGAIPPFLHMPSWRAQGLYTKPVYAEEQMESCKATF
jgi:hypothetical protein